MAEDTPCPPRIHPHQRPTRSRFPNHSRTEGEERDAQPESSSGERGVCDPKVVTTQKTEVVPLTVTYLYRGKKSLKNQAKQAIQETPFKILDFSTSQTKWEVLKGFSSVDP